MQIYKITDIIIDIIINIFQDEKMASPLKRIQSSNFFPLQEPKRLRFDLENTPPSVSKTALEALPKTPSKTQKLLTLVNRIKAGKPAAKTSLKDYIQNLDENGLKNSFKAHQYFSENIEAVDELFDALEVINSLAHCKKVDSLRLTFAELIASIEDMDLLSQPDIQSFLLSIELSGPHHSLPLILMTGSHYLFYEIPKEQLENFRSPVNEHNLLHYAAHFFPLSLYLELLEKLEIDERGTNREKMSSLAVLFKALGASSSKVYELNAFFDSLFKIDFMSNQPERFNQISFILEDSINYHSLQMTVLVMEKMREWNIAIDKMIPIMELDKDSLGATALLKSKCDTADLTLKDAKGQTLLHWAIALGNIPLFTELSHTSLVDQIDDFGHSPLHLAVMIPHVDSTILQGLIELNPHALYQKDNDGFTPLELALQCERYENFKRIYAFEPSYTPSKIDAGLWYAATDQANLFELPEDITEGTNALHVASALNSSNVLDKCLNGDFNWHKVSHNGYRPLALAIQANNTDAAYQICDHLKYLDGSFNREIAIDIIKICLKSPEELDHFVFQASIETFIQKDAQNLNPLDYAALHGGSALLDRLEQSIRRVEEKQANEALKQGNLKSCSSELPRRRR